MERIKMRKVIGGKKYNTETAILVADDVFWDGHNFERSGTNNWLYRTPKGAWFTVYGTFWQGQRDTLTPISEDEARELYEGELSEHYLEWEEAFNAEPQEPESGRPTFYGKPMKQTAIWLPEHMLEWLKAQPASVSETMRSLIEQAMEKQV